MSAPARFSLSEMERRLRAARALMADHDLDALVVAGNSGVNRHNNVGPFWLTQYLDLHHSYVVVPREGELALYTGLVNHVPDAREVAADVAIVEWGGYQPGDKLAARLRELGARRIGLVGIAATWSVDMPWSHRERLAEFEQVDVTREFAALRAVKSEEEIERIRAAARLTDVAILAVVKHAKPGVSEQELVAEAEH